MAQQIAQNRGAINADARLRQGKLKSGWLYALVRVVIFTKKEYGV